MAKSQSSNFEHSLIRGPIPLVPTTLKALKHQVWKRNEKCECDQCVPTLYSIAHCDNWHLPISLHKFLERRCAISIRRPNDKRIFPQPVPPAVPSQCIGIMHLVRDHIAMLDRVYLGHENFQETTACLRLQALVYVWRAKLGSLDLLKTMSSEEMERFLQSLNLVFFFGLIPFNDKPFRWADKSTTYYGRSTIYEDQRMEPIISLNPTLIAPDAYPEDFSYLNLRGRNRLATLLHELCHAFIHIFACPSCPMFTKSEGSSGHGRAWQVLAAKVEDVALKLLNLRIDLGRHDGCLENVRRHGEFPSKHDLETYKLKDLPPQKLDGFGFHITNLMHVQIFNRTGLEGVSKEEVAEVWASMM